jgi:hypothetical protein
MEAQPSPPLASPVLAEETARIVPGQLRLEVQR